MPTYSYRCTQCQNAFDIQQAFTDDSLTECPACGGHLRKVFSSIGVTFNGSGFYRTDSRSEASGKKPSSKPKKESGDSGSSSEKSSSSEKTSSSGASEPSSSSKTQEKKAPASAT